MSSSGGGRRIAIISDGKAGHLNQSYGLAEALARLRPQVQIEEIEAWPRFKALTRNLVRGDEGLGLTLLIGAGHKTHSTLLALKRSAGCPAVVLMTPSLPKKSFDLVVAPRHDGGTESARHWLTDGPLNRIRASEDKEEGKGVILIGGPSDHYQWRETELIGQISRLCDGSVEWQLSTSRRTPMSFLRKLRELRLPGLESWAFRALPENWLAETLPHSERCWVTPDSASMVYEALSSGAAVGIFELPAEKGSRVAAALTDLAERGLVSTFGGFDVSNQMSMPTEPFAESDRIAKKLADMQWI